MTPSNQTTLKISTQPNDFIELIDHLTEQLPQDFVWTDKDKKTLAKHKANPFKEALKLKPNAAAQALIGQPLTESDITDPTSKPLLSSQKDWLTMVNGWITSDSTIITNPPEEINHHTDYLDMMQMWDTHYRLADQQEDTLSYGSAKLYTYEFERMLATKLFPRLSLTKKINFMALYGESKRLSESEPSVASRFIAELRYIQAYIDQLRVESPEAYKALKQTYHYLAEDIAAVFFYHDRPYPHTNLINKQSWLSYYPATRALFLPYATAEKAPLFTRAYQGAVRTRGYKAVDITAALLSFIDSVQATPYPEQDTDIIDHHAILILALLRDKEHEYEQKQNRYIFKILENYWHSDYLDWLVERSMLPSTVKPLTPWLAKYPVLTLAKLTEKLIDINQKLSEYPDFSKLTKKAIREQYYYEKPAYDDLSKKQHYLEQFLTQQYIELYRNQPRAFNQLTTSILAYSIVLPSTAVASNKKNPTDLAQDKYQNNRCMATMFQLVKQAVNSEKEADNSTGGSAHDESSGDSSNNTAHGLSSEQLADLSPWLINPPWQDKQYRLQAPKYPSHLTLALLPRPVFKDDGKDGIELPLPLLENLVGMLVKSSLNAWVKPLTEKDMFALLAPFTQGSLNGLGQALWENGIREPWAWLMNETALPYLHDFINDNKKEGGDIESCRTADRIMATSVMFRYRNSQKDFTPHIRLALTELLYQAEKGKKRFRSLVYQLLSDICQLMQLDWEELRDVSLPTLGFNSASERIFAFSEPLNINEIANVADESDITTDAATHTLTVKLDHHLAPLLYDEHGNLLRSVPRAKKADSAGKAAHLQRVANEVKTLKKQLSKIYKQLNKQFAQDVLCLQPSLRSVDFMTQHFFTHPLLRRYAQTLFWSVYYPIDPLIDADGNKEPRYRIGETFLLLDDGTLTNLHYDTYNAHNVVDWQKKGGMIALTHPAYLSAKEQTLAQEMLADYGIVQPIAQMTLALTAEEIQLSRLIRFEGSVFHYAKLVSNPLEPNLHYIPTKKGDEDGGNYSVYVAGVKNDRYGIKLMFAQPFLSCTYINGQRNFNNNNLLAVQIKTAYIDTSQPIMASRLIKKLNDIAHSP